MKIFSLKKMAILLAMAAMTSSAPVFSHGFHPFQHRHHHRPCPTVAEVRNFEELAILFFNGFVGNLNNVFVFQAATRLAGGDPNPATNPTLAAFIAAETGNAAVTSQLLGDILIDLGAPEAAVIAFYNQLGNYFLAGVNYSTVVATEPGNVAAQQAAFNAWQAAANLLVLDIFALDNFNETQRARIQDQVNQLVINQAQAVLGFNLLDGLNFVSAVQDDTAAHQNATVIIQTITKRLFRLDCRS